MRYPYQLMAGELLHVNVRDQDLKWEVQVLCITDSQVALFGVPLDWFILLSTIIQASAKDQLKLRFQVMKPYGR